MNGWEVSGLRSPVYLVPVVLVAVLALIVGGCFPGSVGPR
jgi:hypothetical protein